MTNWSRVWIEENEKKMQVSTAEKKKCLNVSSDARQVDKFFLKIAYMEIMC